MIIYHWEYVNNLENCNIGSNVVLVTDRHIISMITSFIREKDQHYNVDLYA